MPNDDSFMIWSLGIMNTHSNMVLLHNDQLIPKHPFMSKRKANNKMPCHIWRHWQHLSIYYWSSIYIFFIFFLYISCPGGSVKTLVILQKNIWSKKVNLHTYSSEWQWNSQLNLKLAILQLNFPHILRQLFEHFIKKRSNLNS